MNTDMPPEVAAEHARAKAEAQAAAAPLRAYMDELRGRLREADSTTPTTPDPYATWDPSEATDDSDGLPDRAIVPLVENLRARGVVTLQSCAGHKGSDDGTLWVHADSVDGAHIRLFLVGEPFDRVQYVHWPEPRWEFIWHPDRAEEAMRLLAGLLPGVDAGQSATPTTGAEPVDLDAIVRRAQQAKSHALNLANLLQLLAPNPPEHDHDDRILAALDAVFPLAARARELEAERDRLRAALTTAEVCESDIIHELTQALGLPTDHVASDHCPMPDCDADVSGATHLVWHLARECADSQVQAAEVDRLRGELAELRETASQWLGQADTLTEIASEQPSTVLGHEGQPQALVDAAHRQVAQARRDIAAATLRAAGRKLAAVMPAAATRLGDMARAIAAGELEVPTDATAPTGTETDDA